jgi:hypothetical protein
VPPRRIAPMRFRLSPKRAAAGQDGAFRIPPVHSCASHGGPGRGRSARPPRNGAGS